MRSILFSLLFSLFSVSSLFAEPIDISTWYRANASVDMTYYKGYRFETDGTTRVFHFDTGGILLSEADFVAGVESGAIPMVEYFDGLVPVYGGYVSDGIPPIYYFTLGGQEFLVRFTAFAFSASPYGVKAIFSSDGSILLDDLRSNHSNMFKFPDKAMLLEL